MFELEHVIDVLYLTFIELEKLESRIFGDETLH